MESAVYQGMAIEEYEQRSLTGHIGLQKLFRRALTWRGQHTIILAILYQRPGEE